MIPAPLEHERIGIDIIPADWEVRTIGEEFEVSAGGDWDRPNSSMTQSHEFPFPIYANALTNDGIQGYCRYWRIPGESLTITGRGDVGKAIFRPDPFVPIVRLLALVPKRGASARFYASYINSRVKFALESTGVPQLTAPQVRPYAIAGPPLAEQHAVAMVLADADNQVIALEQLIAKKEAIKQGMMQQLLTGKGRLPGFNNEWRRVKLEQVARFSKGSGLSKSDLLAYGAQPCIHYGELFTYYGAEIQTVASRTDRTELPVRSESMDVLMPTSDVTPRGLAKASAIMDSGVVLGGDILVIRPNPSQIYGPFLAHTIRGDAGQVLALVRGTTIFHLYASDMRSFSILLPAIEEQEAICVVLRDAQSEIDRLMTRLTKAKAITQSMMQELLTGRTRLPVRDEVPA